MTEIKKTLAILKARWPEVTLLIGIGVLSAFLSNRFRAEKSGLNIIQLLLYLGSYLALTVVYAILNCGFLRTVYLGGKEQHPPKVLLKTGAYFFWRMVIVVILFTIAYIPLFGLILFAIKSLMSQYWSYLSIYQLSIIAVLMLLIKPLLLMPALIIVLDCGVFKSWKSLKYCKLLDAKELVALFCFQMAIPFLWILLRIPYGAKGISQNILTVTPTIITYSINLMVAVMAVRFVASLDLLYDNLPASLDFEDLRKYSNRDFKE